MNSTLAGVSAPRVRVQVPAYGCWWADVDLADDVQLTGRVKLELADVSLSGTIVSGGPFNGRASYRFVGGAGGWGQEIDAQGYADEAGVSAGMVLTDAAALVGEALGDTLADLLGPHYARSRGPAYRVLHDLAPRAWYVDFDGITRFGSRASSAYTGDGAQTRVDANGQIVSIATEQIAALVPGVVIDGGAPATDVEYTLDDKRLAVTVWKGARTSRRLEAWRKIFDALDPRRSYRGVYEYRVVTASGERLNLQPVRVASNMPDLERVPVRGPAGYKATVQLGELVLVCFADADPSRPQVIAHDAPDAPGWAPTIIELGADAEFAAIASKTKGEIEALQQWCSTHVHTHPQGPTTGLVEPPPSIGDVAAEVVKIV